MLPPDGCRLEPDGKARWQSTTGRPVPPNMRVQRTRAARLARLRLAAEAPPVRRREGIEWLIKT